jgi:hypothetical protein
VLGDVEHFATHICARVRKAPNGLCDAGRIAPCQIHRVGRPEPLGHLLGKGNTEIAGRACNNGYFIHSLIVIN